MTSIWWSMESWNSVLKYISTSPFLAFFLALDALGCKPQHQCAFGERTCLVLTLFSNWDSESVIWENGITNVICSDDSQGPFKISLFFFIWGPLGPELKIWQQKMAHCLLTSDFGGVGEVSCCWSLLHNQRYVHVLSLKFLLIYPCRLLKLPLDHCWTSLAWQYPVQVCFTLSIFLFLNPSGEELLLISSPQPEAFKIAFGSLLNLLCLTVSCSGRLEILQQRLKLKKMAWC